MSASAAVRIVKHGEQGHHTTRIMQANQGACRTDPYIRMVVAQGRDHRFDSPPVAQQAHPLDSLPAYFRISRLKKTEQVINR